MTASSPTINAGKPARIVGLDVIKLIAMLSVVVSHSLNVLIVHHVDPVFTQICHSLTAGGVPLFFMVSGYLLLSRREITPRYVVHKIFAITRYIAVVCLLYWSVVALIHWDYRLIGECFNEFCNTFVLSGPFTPFWFLWSMAMIYVLLPLIHRLYTRHLRAFTYCTAALGVFCIILFVLLQLDYRLAHQYEVVQPLKMWKWLFFFALGGVIRAYPIPRLRWGWIAVVAIVLNALQRYLLEPVIHDTANLSFAGSPVSILFFVAIFYWAIRRQWTLSPILRSAGILFMPVYTIHYIIIRQLSPYHDLGPASFITFPLLITILSVLISLLILRIPVKGGAARLFKL